MIRFLIDNIFVIFGGHVFQQSSFRWVPTLHTVLFLYSYEAHFLLKPLKKKGKEASRLFFFTLIYIDDIFSLINSKFGNYVDRIYSTKFEIEDTTYTARSASHLDLHIDIDSEDRLRTKAYAK